MPTSPVAYIVDDEIIEVFVNTEDELIPLSISILQPLIIVKLLLLPGTVICSPEEEPIHTHDRPSYTKDCGLFLTSSLPVKFILFPFTSILLSDLVPKEFIFNVTTPSLVLSNISVICISFLYSDIAEAEEA